MNPVEFAAKWRHVVLTESASSHSHFIDLCALVNHPDPVTADPNGDWFTFERGASKAGGGDGWADVWKKGFFGWEYKGKHKDLDVAYLQLLKYQGALENPPLLVTCDTDRIVVHTHFPNTPAQTIELTLDGLADPAQFAVLKAVFDAPDDLRPDKTIQAITEEAAGRVSNIAQALRARGLSPERVARFLDGVVFCLFAEDIGLLPNKVFTRVVQNTQNKPTLFQTQTAALFAHMAVGGAFGADPIEYFNGNLFDATEALEITGDELRELLGVTALDWSNIDASIFGTLFERALDPDKRSQLGAHYTSRADIEMIVEPVVMAPLRHEWSAVRDQFTSVIGDNPSPKQLKDARALVREFLGRLASVIVLDPACGSGNFLYVTLQKLKDLEKEVIVHASEYFPFFPQVGPWQLRGIEVNRYAFDLAQMTVWIGHLQWHNRHGMPLVERPILRPMTNFDRKDGVLTLDGLLVTEPAWPDAEFIVSNPPFLGVRRLRDSLGDEYVEALFRLWGDRVRSESDYCCYWFEKARAQIEAGKARRVGMLATQGIRAGASREVLRRIKESGDIFFAVSDREWILDGATVHVSMVGFDDGSQAQRILDGAPVVSVNADLTSGVDVTTAVQLSANAGISFMGDTKGGSFDIEGSVAVGWLYEPNPHGRPNSDVLRPWVNGLDLTRHGRGMWIIDVPADMSRGQAAHYEHPFEHLQEHVFRERRSHRTSLLAKRWWQHERPRPDLRQALTPLSRYLGTPRVSKHRLFVWLTPEVLADCALIAFAREDDYTFGVLHSRVHETWARATGSQLREEESGFRYTPTSTFEAFPFPHASEVQREAIAAAARELDAVRERWLNPPEWSREETTTFPASIVGPWRHLVKAPNAKGIGTATYRRPVPIDDDAATALRSRTLTTLYNEPPTWLSDLHTTLNEAVFAAYGWDPATTDAGLLALLLERNLTLHVKASRAAKQPELPTLLRPVPVKGRKRKPPAVPKAEPAISRRNQKKKAS